MKKQTFLAGIVLSAMFSVTVFAAPSTVGISNVEYHTADEILTMYHLMNLDQKVALSYDVQPDVSGLSTSGALSEEYQQYALDTLNFARYIAGVSYDVTINETYAQNSQDGALALAVLGGGADHYILQPDGMSDSMFSSAYLGTSKANVSAGINDLATNIIHGWLSDEGENNQYLLGHRRTILAPELTETGFGLVTNVSGANYSSYSTMSVQNLGFGGDEVGVSWPAQTMPIEYFNDDYPWIFITGSYVGSNVSVTITRENDGKTWTMKDDFFEGSTGDGFICANSDYIGQPGCVIFEPNNISYSAGDVYNVEISGPVTASYSVTFISLEDDYTPQSHVAYGDSGSTETTTPQVEEPVTIYDVSGASSWAQAELQQAIDEGFPVAIYSEKFTEDMTRGEFAHMLGLFCDNKWNITGDYSTTSFTDLGTDPADAERNEYIRILSSPDWGVINGKTTTTFAPDDTITREAIAKLLLGVTNLSFTPSITQDISSYSDYNSVSDWALEGVRYMNQKGVLNGTSDNRLDPQGNVTVEQAALMCYRFFG